MSTKILLKALKKKEIRITYIKTIKDIYEGTSMYHLRVA